MCARSARPNVRDVETAETVTEAIAILEADGYRTDFSFTDGTIRCTACDVAHAPPQLLVRRTFRFEGETDPGDEAIVLGVECPACGMRGVVVSAYGPDASPEFMELLTQLDN
jgi:hypothetical protein